MSTGDMDTLETGPVMELTQALRVLLAARGDGQITITSMGSAREWPRLSQDPLDLNYVPSTMGGAIPLALGLALARPNREVVVLSGDGSLLMSLGCLVTAAGCGAPNLSIILVENGVYEVTGGQKTAAHIAATDFVGLARAAGFPQVVQFRRLSDWRDFAPRLARTQGPRFVCLTVAPTRDAYRLAAPCPMQQQLAGLRQALGQDEG